MAGAHEAIEVEGRWRVVVADDEVEPAVGVQVGRCETPAIGETVTAEGPGGLGKSSVSQVVEKAVVLVAVPRRFADEVRAVELPLLVAFDVCDRTAEKGQSQVRVRAVGDPTVGGIEVEIRVVVTIEKGHSPPPASLIGGGIAELFEGPVAAIAQ